jgi:hypothetical protein
MRIAIGLALALCLALAGTASADDIFLPDNQPTGASNVIPFGGAWPSSSNPNGEFTYQWWIPGSILGGKPFRLTGLATLPVYTGVHTATKAEITIGHNTLATYSTIFVQNLPQPTTLYPEGPWTWNATANTWSPFPLPPTAAFDYNGTDNLTIQIRLYGSTCTVQGSTTLGCYNLNSPNSATRVYNYNTGMYTYPSGRASTSYSGKLQLTVSYVSITGSGSPRPGGTVDLALFAPGDAGLPYQVGTSLGTGPIPIGSRTLNLSLDAILDASVNGYLPTVFQNYAGLLDAQGQGKASVVLPPIPALVGVRLHSAFLTIKAGEPFNLKSISPTYSFTIQT